MNKLTFDEIEKILNSQLFEDHDHEPCRWMYDDVYSTAEDIKEEGEFKEAFLTLGSFECVEQRGGEGKGDEYYTVFYFKDHDVYIQFDGWYASYQGSEYSDMFEVRPEVVSVTQYITV